jgi:hypothetical protein
MSNTAYDLIKRFVTIVSPALITLYITLAQVWGWVGYEKVVLSMAAVTTFLGVIIGLSSKRYNQEVTDLFASDESV